MTGETQAAIAWAVKLLDGFLALTGCILTKEGHAHLEALRAMVKP